MFMLLHISPNISQTHHMPVAPAATSASAEPAPYPRLKVYLILSALLVDGMVMSMLFPFVPALVADVGVPTADVGFYAGLIASAYNISQFFALIFWGRLSDKVGRKPIMLFSLVSVAICQIAFGMSQSLTQAIVTRAVAGLVSACGPVGKALLRDCTPKEHFPRAFSSVGVILGIGFLVGPIVGGSLSRPADSMPSVFGGNFWRTYPYLLPCLASLLPVPISMCCLIRVEEPGRHYCRGGGSSTPPGEQRRPQSHEGKDAAAAPPPPPAPTSGDLDGGADAKSIDGIELSDARRGQHEVRDLDSGLTLTPSEVLSAYPALPFEALAQRHLALEAEATSSTSRRRAGASEAGDATLMQPHERKAQWRGLRGRCASACRLLTSRLMVLIYYMFLLQFVVVGMQEVYPLFASAPRDEQGLGLPPSAIGASLSTLGVALFTFPLVLPRLMKRFGPLSVLRMGACIFFVVNAAIPQLTSLVAVDGDGAPTPALWCGLLVISFVRGCGGMCTFIPSTILLNSMITGRAGLYNGLNDSVSALGRALAPTLSGTIFALSTRHGRDAAFPFDRHFVFYNICSLCVVCLFLSLRLSKAPPCKLCAC